MGQEVIVGQGRQEIPGHRLVNDVGEQSAQGGESEVEREPAGGEEALARFGRSDAEDRMRNGKHICRFASCQSSVLSWFTGSNDRTG
jgi:hypothetical protein